MSREDKRRIEREKRKAEQRTTPVEEEAGGQGAERQRTGPVQYVGEVRSELKRVHWPNRRELATYATAVIIAVVIMTTYIYGVDTVFSELIFQVFG